MISTNFSSSEFLCLSPKFRPSCFFQGKFYCKRQSIDICGFSPSALTLWGTFKKKEFTFWLLVQEEALNYHLLQLCVDKPLPTSRIFLIFSWTNNYLLRYRLWGFVQRWIQFDAQLNIHQSGWWLVLVEKAGVIINSITHGLELGFETTWNPFITVSHMYKVLLMSRIREHHGSSFHNLFDWKKLTWIRKYFWNKDSRSTLS